MKLIFSRPSSVIEFAYWICGIELIRKLMITCQLQRDSVRVHGIFSKSLNPISLLSAYPAWMESQWLALLAP